MPSISHQLTTSRLLLRPFNDSDLANVFKGLSDPAVVKYYGVSYNTLAETELQMAWFKELEANNTGKWWAITDRADEAFYGGIGLNNLNKEHQKAEIGFWLLPNFWGKGIVQEAAILACTYGFQQMGLHRIEALVESENRSCKSLMDKLSFKHEGTMQDCELKNGNFISLEIYAKFY
jgi:ribosomal-protein-alanine N-acetyltransferase